MSTAHPSLVRIARLVLALAMCASLGLHWAALQAVAWTQMIVTYSQYEDLGVAVKKTFDGAHPCDLCLLVRDGQNDKKNSQATQLTKKLDAVVARAEVASTQDSQAIEFPDFETCAVGWQSIPPGPPPRV